MLPDGFGETDRRVTVCGLECKDRLEALQRIFEHEMVRLAEQLCWGSSHCAAARFQDIAERSFLHRAHTHDLIARRETGGGIGNPTRCPRGLCFRRKAADRPNQSDHKTGYRAGRGP